MTTSPRFLLASLAASALASCSPPPAAATAPAPAASASAAPLAVTAPPLFAVPASSASAPVAPPPASAVSAAPAPAPPPAASSSASPAAPSAVRVENIGVHIGGGPNDDATKAPIRDSIAPHFPAFAACFAKAEGAAKGGDFGVDLRVPRDGGKAAVSHPRTAIRGEAFVACVVDEFSAVEFRKPRGGETMASYSLRFRP